jgi:hypothetical protein
MVRDKKGTSTPLNKVIARGAFGAQLDFWRQRMGADVADVYYPAFLINGKQTIEYPDFKRRKGKSMLLMAELLLLLDDFGGEDPVLVSSDGHDVVPVVKTRHLLVSQKPMILL